MREPFAGKISSWKSVWVRCGACARWEMVLGRDEPGGSHREAEGLIRRGGWSLTRARGWVCPDCRGNP